MTKLWLWLLLIGSVAGQSVSVQTHANCDPLPDGTHGKSGQECWVREQYDLDWNEYKGYAECVSPNKIVWKGEPNQSAWRCEIAKVVPAISHKSPDADYVYVGTNPDAPWCRIVMALSEPPHCKKSRPQNDWWTCADKTRVLLSTEEGKHICIKF